MSELKGRKLYVNLGASQTRRRLKNFGHGVRKIQTAGRNQALIIHTATGDHLAELEAKFADVGFASHETGLSPPIENLPNLGPRSCQWLRDVGIPTIGQLKRVGPAVAFQMVQRRHPAASLNLLWGLVAGLQDRDWRTLTESEKQPLRDQLDR